MTKPRLAGKIFVIFTGYKESVNELIGVNQGLSSRFLEEVIFTDMERVDCWRFLQEQLATRGIAIDQTDACASSLEVISFSRELSSLPSWGNGCELQTMSKSITGAKIRNAGSSTAKLIVSHREIMASVTTFLTERRARSVIGSSQSTRIVQNEQATQDLVERQVSPRTTQSTVPAEDASRTPITVVEKPMQVSKVSDQRDRGVTDAIWDKLQADVASKEQAQNSMSDAVATACGGEVVWAAPGAVVIRKWSPETGTTEC